jgi:TolB-like protein/Flp pilus assembly protein TadD
MTRPFHVGEWLVEPDLNRISRKGQTVPIEPKVIRVLECLADHPGEVLSKEKIIRTVWPDTYVSDGILTYSMTILRKAFDDDAKNPRVIQTIARKGYRLVAPVEGREIGHAALPSIAVLAFSDMSVEKDQEYFCDGIAEEIINNLTHLRGLRVASRTSAFAFKNKPDDVRNIGRKLGVDTVLEGSVRKSHNCLRITIQLVKVQDGCHLMSERYDREPKDVFAIQDEISRSIAAILKVTLSPQESDSLRRVPTTDINAYDYYLRGRQFFYQYRRRGIEFALKMFSRAIELDPEYVRAYAGIADCCSFLYLYAGSHEIHRTQADDASRKAIDLNPASAEAQASRGVALSIKGDHAQAESAFENAIRLDPLLFEAYYFYARDSFAQAKPERAIELYRKASEISPHDYQARLLVAQIFDDLGRHDEARDCRRLGIEAAEARLKLNPDDVRALYMGANGLVALGEYEKGLEWAGMALEMDPNEPMVLYNVACIQSLAGRPGDAINTLEKAVHSGLTQRGWLENDSNLQPLRSNPRYQALIDSMSSGATDPTN